MALYWVDPLKDDRYSELISRDPQASVFHSIGWLNALRFTYDYEPIVLTHSPPGGQLHDAIVFCQVSSRLTGTRLVSLPFSDHCQPLVHEADNLASMLGELQRLCDDTKWKYVELRPLAKFSFGEQLFQPFSSAQNFCFHTLDLSPSTDSLFRGFHKDCVQRRIRKAEREKVTYKSGRSESLLCQFYHLQTLTRRRQGLPPQPLEWFRNLMRFLPEEFSISVATIEERPIAAIASLRTDRSYVYKYGCSDDRYNRAGGMQLLFWKMIEKAKYLQISELDMGRSDMENEGLIRFKDRWGAHRSSLMYFRYPSSLKSNSPGWKTKVAKVVLSALPKRVLVTIGKNFYRHLA